jgi:Dolichyl-phosphate-mannose-protein mannosyltransferase
MKIGQHKLLDYWPLFFLLASLEAAVALLTLLRIPSEGAGYSITRWVLILALLGATVAFISAAYFAWRSSFFFSRWLDPLSQPKFHSVLNIAFPLLATATSIGAYTLRWWDPNRMFSTFERAWPLLGFIILFSLQSTVWLLAIRFGIHKPVFEARKHAFIAFVILLFVFGFVSLTKLGLTPDPAYWGEPGVPIQGWQLGLALTLSVLFLFLRLSHHPRGLPFFKANPRRTDFLIGLLIWALGTGIWLSVPNDVLKNSFYFPIGPPANMPLPHSDSAYYDSMAHSLLIGTDYLGEIPTRPLYILFLTFLHLLFGENYNLIIYAQSYVLATFPVVLYLLGKKLHSRLAGITIALFAIFREWTNLLVSSDTRVSNTKMLLVDIPTLLLILLACLFAFRWLERKDKRSAFIAGGIFGFLLLLRTQSMLILPFIFAVAFLALRSEKRPWIAPFLMFTLGIVVSIAPWLTHNYLRIGKFAFDAPFQYQVLASQYAYTGNLDFQAVDLENKSLSQILVTFAFRDPGFVAGFISNHFLATEVDTLLALPLIVSFNGLREPVNLYWTTFAGFLSWSNILILISYLAIIAIGLGVSWKRWRWAGLLPLAYNLGYAAANGIGRFSGWRYDLPADWIAYFYFGIGFVEILFWLASFFGTRFSDTEDADKTDSVVSKRMWASQILPLAVVFAFIGALPWIAESVNPPARYPISEHANLLAQIAELQNVISIDEVQAFGRQPESTILEGRLLYPRTFSANAGMASATPWPSYAPRDYPRLGFRLLNHDVRDVVFPNKGVPVENVHGRDVIVLGCQRENYVEARLLVFPNTNLTYLSNLALEPCSP